MGGAKLTIDGSPQGFTAWRDRPYYKPTSNYRADYVGYAAATNDQVFEAIDRAFSKGYQILTHSNGEASSDLLLAAISVAEDKYGKADRRPVLVHGQFPQRGSGRSDQGTRCFPVALSMHTFYWGDCIGPDGRPGACDNISPTGWALKRGVKFSSHHDAPVALPDSIRILSATVARRSRSGDIIGPDQRVDPITALKAMTIWPAYQYFEDDQKGSIEVGKLADLVILSEDPTAIDSESLYRIKVVETIKEGQSVYRIGDDKLPKRPRSILILSEICCAAWQCHAMPPITHPTRSARRLRRSTAPRRMMRPACRVCCLGCSTLRIAELDTRSNVCSTVGAFRAVVAPGAQAQPPRITRQSRSDASRSSVIGCKLHWLG